MRAELQQRPRADSVTDVGGAPAAALLHGDARALLRRRLVTAALCLSFTGLGLVLALLGPCLDTLTHLVRA